MKKEDIYLIEDYLLGRLNTAEHQAVAQRAMEDRLFAAEIALQKDILDGIKWHEDQIIKQQIAYIDETLAKSGFFEKGAVTPSSPKTKYNLITWKWAFVLGVIMAAFSIVWYFAQNNKPSPTLPDPKPEAAQPIAQNNQNHEPTATEKTNPKPRISSRNTLKQSPLWVPPDYTNYRSEDRQIPLIEQSVVAFQRKKYAEVLRITAKVTASDPNYWFFQEMNGHAAYLSGRFATATRCFETIAQSGQLPFSERAEWYLLLCYFTDYERYKDDFTQLQQKIMRDTAHPYYEQARDLK